MAQFTLQVETAASKAQASQEKNGILFYILPPALVIAVLAIVYFVDPPAPAQPAAGDTTVQTEEATEGTAEESTEQTTEDAAE